MRNKAFSKRFDAAINTDNPDKAAAIYTGDAILVGQPALGTTGLDRAKKLYAGTFEKFAGKFKTTDDIEAARIEGNTMWYVGPSTNQMGGTQSTSVGLLG